MRKKFLDHFLPYQREWLKSNEVYKIGLWARQTGKDFTCAAEAALDCMRHPRRTWLIVACGERQAIESLEKARLWVGKFEKTLRREDRHNCKARSESATEIRFENGSRILALPSKPATVRGYSASVILTEFAFHDHPEAIWRAVYPIVSNPLSGGEKKLRIISTPNGLGNLFHTFWTDSKIFWRQRITIHDACAKGLPLNLPRLKQGILDPEAWSQEYECQFIDRSSVLLPYDLIEQCESPEAFTANTPDGLSRCGELFFGIDFGRKHDLTVCWALERIGGELWTREVLVLPRTSTPDQLEILRPRLQRARRICLDYTGAGIGLGDLLAQQFGRARDSHDFNSRLELCTFTAGLKQEIFAKLRAGFERRKIWIPHDTDVREDLHAMHRVVSSSGMISYRATHHADGHSDRCTALALALRAAESAPVLAAASSVGSKYRSLRRF